MSKWLSALLIALACTQVQAAPVSQEREAAMNRAQAERGLLTRLADQVTEQAQGVAGRASEMAQQASDLVMNAMGALGVPYRRGGSSTETGFDCSGFVKSVYEQTLGLVLPRRANEQAAAGESIERSELQPGDLVFFNTMRRAFSHVGIYVGDGKFIHAPKPGARVRVEDMSASYWSRRFEGARRIMGLPAAEEAGTRQ